jgi:hypothetical protein
LHGRYVEEICGTRFNHKKNEIKIVCTRSRNREHNRQWWGLRAS